MTLANRLRAQMRWRGIKSQNQLARISGVPQSSIHRILARGDAYSPTWHTIQRLARALGTTTAWLLDGEPGPAATAHALPESGSPPLSADGYDAELQAALARLPADARRKIVAVLRLIADGAAVPRQPRPGQRP
ncbi:helix-turn-helix domain-containing protein [Bordetella sp. 2513F-2]